jgi:hypothetical protein
MRKLFRPSSKKKAERKKAESLALPDRPAVQSSGARFGDVREAISGVLDRMTIADMVATSEGGNVTPMVTGRSAASGRKRR